jgi:predicted membrane channel-forming protein YqfA (hemolysin III family)
MDEVLLLRMSGGFGSSFDVIALITFIAFGVVYMLVPLVAHTRERPASLSLSLYLVIGCIAVSLLQSLYLSYHSLDRNAGGMFDPFRGVGFGAHLLFLFLAAKGVLLVGSLLCFAIGLQTIRWREPQTQAFEQAVSKLQQLRDENVRLRKQLEQANSDDDV